MKRFKVRPVASLLAALKNREGPTIPAFKKKLSRYTKQQSLELAKKTIPSFQKKGGDFILVERGLSDPFLLLFTDPKGINARIRLGKKIKEAAYQAKTRSILRLLLQEEKPSWSEIKIDAAVQQMGKGELLPWMNAAIDKRVDFLLQ